MASARNKEVSLPANVSVFRELVIEGSTVFRESDFEQVVQSVFQPKDGQAPTTEKEISDRLVSGVTQLYLSRGYITSLAEVDPGASTKEALQIRVTEGQLVRITVENLRRLNSAYICRRIQLGTGTPLNVTQLEEQLKLLRVDPLLENIEASLRASPERNPGESVLIVRVKEATAFTAGFGADNYSPPSVGSERIGVELRYRNLMGIGDEVAGSYYRSTTGGADTFDFSYLVSLNPMNGTLQLRAAPNRNEVTQPPFNELGIRGKQQVYEITYRQPFLRSPREELALALGFTYQNGQTFLFDQLPTPFGIGPDENGVSRTSVLRFGQDYTRRDTQGIWSFRSQFNFGTGLFNATTNDAPIPDGHFFSWYGQAQRIQKLGENNLLLIQVNLQLTPDSLLPSQQFVIGGGQSVRGYRQNVRSGDNGIQFVIENRFTVYRDESGSTIQLAPFFNLGKVWNQADNPNKLPDQTFLVGGGLGLLWEQAMGIQGLSLRLDYGVPFIQLVDRGKNAQDQGFYFSVRYQTK
ncbi:MAG: ShlB/FhaC/HecB family hemolysin secretion/activation protein [Kovacikia sp.]